MGIHHKKFRLNYDGPPKAGGPGLSVPPGTARDIIYKNNILTVDIMNHRAIAS